MESLLKTLFAVSMFGWALIGVSTIVLLTGRKDNSTVREIVVGGRLGREEKEAKFHRRSIFWSNILKYPGLVIFFLPWVYFAWLLFTAQPVE